MTYTIYLKYCLFYKFSGCALIQIPDLIIWMYDKVKGKKGNQGHSNQKHLMDAKKYFRRGKMFKKQKEKYCKQVFGPKRDAEACSVTKPSANSRYAMPRNI